MLIWLFVYLWKNVYSDFAHFLVGQIRKHWLLGLRVPYIFCMTCKNFHSVGCPVSSMVFTELFNFHEVQFICFFFCRIFEKALSSPRSWRFTPTFSPRFLVLAITFQCLICFELNFSYEKKICVWCEEGVQLPNEYCCEVSKTSWFFSLVEDLLSMPGCL